MFNKRKQSNASFKPRSSVGHTPKHKNYQRLGLSSYVPGLDFDDEESVLLDKCDSIDLLLPRLSEDEAVFFNMVEIGNLRKVKQFLSESENFNINCKNYQGFTALIITIKNEDLDTLQYFLSWEHVQIGEAFLHAVETGSLQIVKAFIKGCEGVSHRKQVEFTASADHSVAFSPHTTPLMLAAHQGHYEIIRYLLRRGQVIDRPHACECLCESCQTNIDNENLADAMLRLNIYKAIAHPHYICQSTTDPILTAFQLCSELKSLALMDREFSKEFTSLAAQCSKFAVDILDQCRNSDEVGIVLHRKEGNKRAQLRPGYRFTRIGLAIQHKQKDFVAHSCCQQALRKAWIKGFPMWKRLSTFQRGIRLVPQILILPFMALIYIFTPKVKFVARYFDSPLQKYVNHTVAYLLFIVLLMWQTIIDSQKDERGPPHTGLEPGIILFVVAFFCGNIKRLLSKGAKSYLENRWNLYDMALYGMFLTSFAVWTWCKYDLDTKEHVRHMPRKFWKSNDPTLVGEAVYSVAIVLALLRITFFYQVLPGIGPLQLSFSRLFTDIIKFFSIFFTVLFAFAFGLFQLYHNYEGMRRTENGEVIKQRDAFITIDATLSSLYWCLYGYGSPDYANVVLESYLERDGDNTVILYNHHHLTEIVGRTIFAIYHIAAFVILLNMLIAMMTQSLEKIDENADSEWKFSRTRVWMAYLQRGGALPPPFNIVPTFKMMDTVGRWIVYRCRGNPDAQFNPSVCCYIDYEEQTKDEKEKEDLYFIEVMAYLVQRYLTSNDNMKEDLTATKDDIESVRHYLRDLREDLEEDTSRQGSEASILKDQTFDSVFFKGKK